METLQAMHNACTVNIRFTDISYIPIFTRQFDAWTKSYIFFKNIISY